VRGAVRVGCWCQLDPSHVERLADELRAIRSSVYRHEVARLLDPLVGRTRSVPRAHWP
jgi:hypothetical protein